MRRDLVTALVGSMSLFGTRAVAQDSVQGPSAPTARRVDLGARAAYARPVGAFDAGTHARDGSFGGIPLALDVTWRLSEGSRWSVSAGVLGSYGPSIPTLCTNTSECISSIGHDTELGLLARIRAPRIAFVLPEAELGTGWSWSSRYLVDHDATSTRSWSGPVLVRAALVPAIALGSHTRLGLVLGGSIARSTSFTLEAPGLERHGIDGARLHGTLDAGLRFGVDFGD